MKFVQKIEDININNINEISAHFNVPDLVSKILISRGINTIDKADKFFNSTVEDLNDPFLFNNMKKVVEKIEKAVENNKKIVIFGDYDVDGISATAILFKFLQSKNADVDYFLPSRYLEGYGLSAQTVERVFELHNPNLIITVDCGITAIKEIELIKSKGCDVIITDHHEPLETLPDCLIIDAKVKTENYPFKELCGTGVALKIVQAFVGTKNIAPYLPICAIATASDVVMLVDENRVIVKEGFKLFEDFLPIGLKEFLKALNVDETISANDFIFKVTPKLNAAGRLGDAYEALKLYITNDMVKIHKAINNLIDMNEKRKNLCDIALQECEKNIKNDLDFANKKIIIFKSENWDSGMLGIVCARLLEEYGKPVILFSQEDGKLVGSMRSIKGIDVVKVFNNVSHILEKFGGHSMAGGLTILPENFEQFKNEVESYLENIYDPSTYIIEKNYDCEILESELTLSLAKQIEKLAPFGYCNEKPIFKFKLKNVRAYKMAKYPQHLILKIGKNNCIYFNGGEYKEFFSCFKEIDALLMLEMNNYNSTEKLKCLIKEIKPCYNTNNLHLARENMAEMFNCFKLLIEKNQYFESNENMFLFLKLNVKKFKKYNYFEFYVALKTFIELNVIDKINENNCFRLIIGKVLKTELINSRTYKENINNN